MINEQINERFIEASRVAQVVFVAVVFVVVGFSFATDWLINNWIPNASIQELTVVWDRFLIRLLGLMIVCAALSSFYFGRMGFRAIASGEFPPPGTLVWRRTKVIFGSEARRAGWWSIVLAGIGWLPVAAIAVDLAKK